MKYNAAATKQKLTQKIAALLIPQGN